MAAVDRVIEAIGAGKPVLLPTDTVYGLCATPYRDESVLQLATLKGRAEQQPIALVAASIEQLFECVPELRGPADAVMRTLLPGPYTLVLGNPARRFPWLTGVRPETIGVRVPVLSADVRSVLVATGGVAATSANLAGGVDPASLADVPDELRAACAAELDAGLLPGTPSTVLDLSGDEPQVLREGAAPAHAALERVRAALLSM